MKFFIDTANIDEIKECDSLGILDGVTTNPSLVAKDVKNKNEVYKAYEKICEICGERPVSCEVIATECDDIIKEARELRKIADNVCVKIAISEDGIKACKTLTEEEIMTNMTLCFSPVQALLCAKAGATFVSPFLGRLDDINVAGIDLITKIRTIFDNYAFGTEILSASIRSVLHVEQVAEVGSDVATIPYKIIKQLFKHPLTDAGLKKFLEDYKKLD